MKKSVFALMMICVCAFHFYGNSFADFSCPSPAPNTGVTYTGCFAADSVNGYHGVLWFTDSATSHYNSLANDAPLHTSWDGQVSVEGSGQVYYQWICNSSYQNCQVNGAYNPSYFNGVFTNSGTYQNPIWGLSASYTGFNSTKNVVDPYGNPVYTIPVETPLRFPLDNVTAYTAEVSAVMDKSTLGTGAVYEAGEDNEVESFEGEVGDVGPHSNSTCYSKFDNTAFGTSVNYVGTYDTGGAYYLCYDAHPGYDYPKARYADIHAPADGVLCVATSTTQQQQPADVWRDTTHCPYSTAGSTSWPGYHTFYIIHEGLHINGSTNDYMTVFLHSDDLENGENGVRDDIEEFGHRYVTRGEHIAEIGDVGSSGAYHMHFEVYKKNGANWDRVDPYGDGINNILWEQN